MKGSIFGRKFKWRSRHQYSGATRAFFKGLYVHMVFDVVPWPRLRSTTRDVDPSDFSLCCRFKFTRNSNNISATRPTICLYALVDYMCFEYYCMMIMINGWSLAGWLLMRTFSRIVYNMGRTIVTKPCYNVKR